MDFMEEQAAKEQTTRKVKFPESIKNVIKGRLAEEKEMVLKKLAESEDKLRKAQAESGFDLSDENGNRGTDLKIIQQTRETSKKILKKINIAFLRLANGHYGICANCGEDIDTRRLTTVPWTDLCTVCKKEKNALIKTSFC